MVFFRKSLSQDVIDHFSSTWACLLLLLLSALMIFIPLSPCMKMTATKHSQMKDNIMKGETSRFVIGAAKPSLLFKASCWAPYHFTGAMVDYANEICTAAINDIAQGKNSSVATLHKLSLDSNAHLLLDSEEMYSKMKDQESVRTESEKLQSDIYDLISYKTPLYLSIFAMCLLMPYALWSILASFCGCINADQTLMMVQQGLVSNPEAQDMLREKVTMTLQKSTKKSTALLYLAMKLLMVVIVSVELVVVNDAFLNQTSNMEEDLNQLHTMVIANEGIEQQSAMYLCKFRIHNLQNIQLFSLQCSFTPFQKQLNIEVSDGRDTTWKSQLGSYSLPEQQVLLMYKALFHMILAFLSVLAALNVSSLLIWLFKLLMPSCRPNIGLKPATSLDMVFLVCMAWNNSSGMVAMELVRCSSRHGDNAYSD